MGLFKSLANAVLKDIANDVVDGLTDTPSSKTKAKVTTQSTSASSKKTTAVKKSNYMCTHCGIKYYALTHRPSPGACYKRGKYSTDMTKPHVWVKY